MKKGKAPGCDGLTIDFYASLWDNLRSWLVPLYDIIINEQHKLNPTACRGIISLIPKKDKDPTEIKNWRPLTLLNNDYKILAKIMANRMKRVLPMIISETQTGFMQGRNISDNIRKTIDLVTFINKTGKAAIIINLDYEKCFDRIAHKAVYGALDYFVFGEWFSNVIKVFFSDFMFVVGNAGFYSEYKAKTRGVNQGCPVSPYLFLLCAEIMAHKIKENTKIRGIRMGDVEHIISQFADDTILFLDNDQVSLEAAIDTLVYIENTIGLKISYEKTTIYRLGSIKHTDAKLYCQKNLQWSDGDIETLGILISNSENQNGNMYNKIMDRAEAILDGWYVRRLSLIGKVMVINTLVASLFVYGMSVLPWMSSAHISRFECIIKRFLWGNKCAKIPLTVLQSNLAEGGLKLVDIKLKQQSLRLVWVKKVHMCQMFTYVNDMLIPELQSLSWKLNLTKKDAMKLKICPSFWRDIWVEWCEVCFKESPSDVLSQILWYNSCIKIGNSVIFWEKLYKLKILRLADLVTDNCIPMTYTAFCQ